MMVCQNNHCAQAKAGDQGLVGLEVVCQNTSSPDFSSGHLQFFPDNSPFPRTKNKIWFLIGHCDIKQGFSFVSPMLCEFWTPFTFIWLPCKFCVVVKMFVWLLFFLMFAFSDCLLFVYRFLCNSPRSSAMCVFLDWIWGEDQSKQVFLNTTTTTTSPLFQVRLRKKRNRGVIFSGDGGERNTRDTSIL